MKPIKLLFVFSSLFISSCFASEESTATNTCNFTRESIALSEPKDAAIINSYWQRTQDAETEEYVDRLFIAYKNGDAAVIEHKYCSIYNFKASYFSTNGEHTASVDKLDQLMINLQKLNALASKLSVVPNDRVIDQLKKSTFDPEKPYRINFDAADKAAENDVSYSFSYDPLGSLGILGSMVSLYVGYGSI